MGTKKSARPPPPPLPPPPAGSSEEEDSRSRSEESEDEAVSHTPTPTPSKPLAPPQRAEESDSSDEGEEGDEEEEEEAPNNPPAPPQKGEESERSDDEEEGDDEEEEEPAHLAAPSAPKNQPPPPPQQSKESDASDEDGESSESDDEEAPPPPPKQAPKRQADAIKPPSAKKARLAFHRIWSTDDEVRILEALAAHQRQHGALPQPDALIGALAGKLDNRAYGSKELQSKLQTLKKRYVVLSSRGELPSKEHDRRLLDLSKIVWGGDKATPAAAAAAEAASGREVKGFDEMCELYPYLAEEVKKLEAAHPGMFKRVFGKMDDGKARAMDEKIKKQRVAQMKVELRRTDLTKEVSKAITELVD